jgi:hypothetical protein
VLKPPDSLALPPVNFTYSPRWKMHSKELTLSLPIRWNWKQ